MNLVHGDTQQELGTLKQYNGTMGDDYGFYLRAYNHLLLHLTIKTLMDKIGL